VSAEYGIKKAGNGLYVFVLGGNVTVDGQTLATRDGLGVRDAASVSFTDMSQGAEILLLEVPMQL
jgi:redox-sensitive bicupin YhaK (pirin superfamily)